MLRIESIIEFAKLTGGFGDNKEPCFVRALGQNAGLADEIHEAEQWLGKEMLQGKGEYKRVEELRVMLGEETAEYLDYYEKWQASGRTKMQCRVIKQRAELEGILAKACVRVLQEYAGANPQATESMQRNVIVKCLFWFDDVMQDMVSGIQSTYGIKVIGRNVIKEQEYLFYYLLTLMGVNVLLLQNEQDVKTKEVLLRLSSQFTLGDFGMCDIASYDRQALLESARASQSNAGTNMGGVHTSGTNSQNSHNVESSQMNHTSNNDNNRTENGNIRVVIPKRPERMRRNQDANGSSSLAESANADSGIQNAFQTAVRNTIDMALAPVAPGEQNQSNGSIWESREETELQQPDEKSFKELATLTASVVLIEVIRVSEEYQQIVGYGSGIMIGRDGYIMTNAHVVEKGNVYAVRIKDDDKVYVTNELVKYHSLYNIAVLRIDRILNPLPVYQGTESLKKGQKVVAIGSTKGMFNAISEGTISDFSETIKDLNMIHYNAPSASGSSGGALLNGKGELIGMNTTESSGGQNLNLAVSYETFYPFIAGFM